MKNYFLPIVNDYEMQSLLLIICLNYRHYILVVNYHVIVLSLIVSEEKQSRFSQLISIRYEY